LDRGVERRLLRRAFAAVFTTEETRRAYRAVFGALPPGGLHVSRCAFDPRLFENLEAEKRRTDRFRLVYTGVYGMVNRNLLGLLEALAGLHRSDWELHLAGRDNSESEDTLGLWLDRHGLSDQVRRRGQLPQARALALQGSADLLLVWGWPGGMQIPAKIYEYIAAERPILLVRGGRDDAAESLVLEGPRGLSVDNSRESLSTVLGEAMDLRAAGRWERRFRLERDMRYTWDAQISILADLLELGGHVV